MDLEFNKNEDKMKILLSDLEGKLKKVFKGGGDAKVKKQHDKGKLTARERIKLLLETTIIIPTYGFL